MRTKLSDIGQTPGFRISHIFNQFHPGSRKRLGNLVKIWCIKGIFHTHKKSILSKEIFKFADNTNT